MANNVFQVKRTSTSGRTPNTTGSYSTNSQYIAAGELALNMADGILYTSNGSSIIEIGANNTNVQVTGNLTVKSIVANGSLGVSGYVLTTNGSSVYWGVAGSGPTTNTSVTRQVFIANSTVNTSFAIAGGYVAYNGDVYLNGSKLVNGTDVDLSSGTNIVLSSPASVGDTIDVVLYSSASAAVINADAQYTWTNTHTFQNTVYLNSISANGSLGTNGQVLTSNGSDAYWASTTPNIRTVSANVTLNANDNIVLANAQLSITLPAASDFTGKYFEIKNINTGQITVYGTGGDLIDGYSNVVIRYKNSMLGVKSISSGWIIY